MIEQWIVLNAPNICAITSANGLLQGEGDSSPTNVVQNVVQRII